MNLLRYCLLLSISLSIFACKGGWKSDLEAQLVDSPTEQNDIDKNIMIKYAVENGLEVKQTESGMFYIIEKEGEGEHPPATAAVKAHYHGTLTDGTKFDSSYDKGKPLEFRLNGVIRGWGEAIPMLKKGGKGKFIIPSRLAYGARGAGQVIKPNSVLVFDIELVDFSTN